VRQPFTSLRSGHILEQAEKYLVTKNSMKPFLTNRTFNVRRSIQPLVSLIGSYPNNCEVIVAIYPLVIGIWVNEDAPRIAIGKANVSHQKKILDNRKQNSEHSKTRSR